ncbi:hypothetical protein HOD29_01210 [archaeon]|jgi:ribosomal protein S15P/S13E|nr:hypothetical protein [archaeon]
MTKTKEEKIKEIQKNPKKKEESKKPAKLTQKAYEKKVQELADEGLTSEKIGEKLRQVGIHPKEFEGKISKILGDKYKNPDLQNVGKKLEAVKAHYEKNKQDKRAKREKDRIFSQLRKLKKYFKIETR